MSKFYQTVIPAEPGTYTLSEERGTGRLRKDFRVIAWAIERFHDRGFDYSGCTITSPVVAGDSAGEDWYVLMPDGRVEGDAVNYDSLAEANEPGACAERCRHREARERVQKQV